MKRFLFLAWLIAAALPACVEEPETEAETGALGSVAERPPPPSRTMPFKLKVVSGHTRAYFDSKKERPFLLIFGYQQCPPCREAWQWADDLSAVKTVGAGIDKTEEEIAALERWWQEEELSYPVVSDRFSILAKRANITNVPAFFAYDAAGGISGPVVGFDGAKREQVRELVARVSAPE